MALNGAVRAFFAVSILRVQWGVVHGIWQEILRLAHWHCYGGALREGLAAVRGRLAFLTDKQTNNQSSLFVVTGWRF